MSEINDVNVWLGRSNWTGDQNLAGEFDVVSVEVFCAGRCVAEADGG